MSATERWRPVSRREVLRRIGGATAAGVMPAVLYRRTGAAPLAAQGQTAAVQDSGAFETLTPAEADVLEALASRLIPTDETGPGAAEARAARYIDRALGGALGDSREAYRSGLAAVDRYARDSRRAPFAQLTEADQDAVIGDLERNVATGFTPSSAAFFGLVLSHTIQGTFCDPYYGGNAAFVGWDLLGYPGVRLGVAAEDQRLGATPEPARTSAYDYTMFSGRRPARAGVDRRGPVHGD
jgi:gluconate 2-dehydrogenase gamma chain